MLPGGLPATKWIDKFRTGTESNQQDSFQIIGTAKATFYGEREEVDETEAAVAQSMHQAKVVEPSEEEIMYNIREITRRQGERDAAARAVREEKKKQKEQRRMDYMKSRLSPQWKLSPGNKFKCSETKKLTANEIMDMVDKGILTNEQAEVEFDKLEEKETREMETDTASVSDIMNMIDNGELTDR